MKRRFEDEPGQTLRDRLIGLGARSHRKSYYPVLRERLAELERFRVLLDEAQDGVLLLDPSDAAVVDCNQAVCRLFGAEVLRPGASLRDVLPPSARPCLEEGLRSAQSGASSPFTLEIPLQAGRRILELVIRPATFHGRAFAVLTARDVTARVASEEALRAKELQLLHAQRLDSIGRLAGGVAHDFNNALTVILAGAEELGRDLRRGTLPDPEIVEEIRAAGERARDLTRQLLAFARRQVIAPVPVDLNGLTRGAEKLLRRVLREDVELVVDLQPGLWSVRCDPGQIEQVILNLAVNARDAMPSGGKLVLSTANVEIDERFTASRPYMRSGQYARFSVRDSGQGMSPEVKAHVFEPFFTTKPLGRGTGLGLATVYGIVKQSDGYILVESEPGRGTTFELFFPRVPEAAAPVEPRPQPRVAGGTETILVVEDDPHVREVTVRSLRGAGYAVLVAKDGRDALDVVARGAGPFHLLVADVVMPGLGGPALADELRRRHPHLRVLFVSGHGEEAIVRQGTLRPGTALLPKPFTAPSLLARVREILDRA